MKSTPYLRISIVVLKTKEVLSISTTSVISLVICYTFIWHFEWCNVQGFRSPKINLSRTPIGQGRNKVLMHLSLHSVKVKCNWAPILLGQSINKDSWNSILKYERWYTCMCMLLILIMMHIENLFVLLCNSFTKTDIRFGLFWAFRFSKTRIF